MGSKISRFRDWWRVFRRVRVESWHWGPLLVVICAMGWGWPTLGAGIYLRGSVIERGPWLTVEPGFGMLSLSWHAHWNDKAESGNPHFEAKG